MVVPTAVTVAPAIGCPSLAEVTFPLTCRFCACAIPMERTHNIKKISNFFLMCVNLNWLQIRISMHSSMKVNLETHFTMLTYYAHYANIVILMTQGKKFIFFY